MSAENPHMPPVTDPSLIFVGGSFIEGDKNITIINDGNSIGDTARQEAGPVHDMGDHYGRTVVPGVLVESHDRPFRDAATTGGVQSPNATPAAPSTEAVLVRNPAPTPAPRPVGHMGIDIVAVPDRPARVGEAGRGSERKIDLTTRRGIADAAMRGYEGYDADAQRRRDNGY